jgi:tetratricopeptide (TPR) repeat protein
VTRSPFLPAIAAAALGLGLALVLALPLAAQQGAPPHQGMQGMQGMRGGMMSGEAGPQMDRCFYAAQELHALDAKVNLLVQMGRTDAALEELARVEAVEVPRNHPVYEVKAHLIGRLAVTLAEAGKKKPAMETLQRLLADVPAGSPAEASAWLDAGTVYKTLSMPDEALKAFDKAIDLAQKLARSGRRSMPMMGPGGRPPGPTPRTNPKGETP